MDITNFLDLGEDKENLTIPTIPDGSDVPITPVSVAFPSSRATSDVESDKAAKLTKPIDEVVRSSSNSAKSVRWAEVALFPEQQSLVNIHSLLRTLVEDCKDEEVSVDCRVGSLLIDFSLIDCKGLRNHEPFLASAWGPRGEEIYAPIYAGGGTGAFTEDP
jgi:hypothetical protein